MKIKKKVKYACPECEEVYNEKDEAEECCEPCDHFREEFSLECNDGEMGFFCSECDQYIGKIEINPKNLKQLMSLKIFKKVKS